MTIRHILLLLLLTLSSRMGFAAEPVPEYQAKAAFLYHFARYTQWPFEVQPPSEIRFCIYGRNTFGNALEEIEGKKIDDIPIGIYYLEDIGAAAQCHLLFLGEQERTPARKILEKLAKLPILTVTDIDGLVADGAILGMSIKNRRIVIEANTAAARLANLTLSSKLLRLAFKIY